MRRKKQWISLAIRIIVSIGILTYLLFKIAWREIPQQMQNADFRYLLAALFATKLAIFISALKWYLLCKQTSNITFWESLRWYYIGFFFSNFLPSSIGGDVPRVFYASKKMGVANAVASITVERVFAGIALVVTVVFGFVAVQGLSDYSNHIWIVGSVFIALYIILFNRTIMRFIMKRFGKSVQGFYLAIEQYKQQKGLLLKLLVFSLAFQICFVSITDLLFRSLGVEVNFLYQIAFIAIISALTMIPISLNGLGVREGSYSYFFALIGIAEVTSITVSLMFYLVVLVATSVGGLFWLLDKKSIDSEYVQEKSRTIIN